ncbi:Efflux pump patC [Lachnellula arida]|uniref:Efflux pump patC n=1 Tax=Lachnellula arida TaxID=1316785 RepID=A0A8T9B4C6_9HELO|nr:Efflux pump patC [Lachnellula arida]
MDKESSALAQEPLAASKDNPSLSNGLLSSEATTNIQGTAPSYNTTASTNARIVDPAIQSRLDALGASLVWGKLHGQFDSKILFILAVLLFKIESAVCGAAPSLNAFIVGRAVAGLGGSGIYVGTINILSGLTSSARRPLYMSFVGSAWSLGTVLGPIIGGAFADSNATWRWSFYINLCIAAAAAPVYIFLLPSQTSGHNGSSIGYRLLQIDFCGSLLFIGATATLTIGISFGGAVFAWQSGSIIGLFACSGVLWVLFSAQQVKCVFTTPENRLFPIHFIRSYEMCILFCQVAACITCLFIPIYFIPLFSQFVRGDSALESGVRLLPFMSLLVAGAIINGAMLGKYGLNMPWFFVGGVLVIIGSSLLHTITIGTSLSRMYGYSVIVAFGAGLFVQAPFSVAQAKVRPEQHPEVTAFITCGQISGIVLSLSIASSMFINESTEQISALLPNVPLKTVRSTLAGVGATLFQSLTAVERLDVLNILVSVIDRIFILVIVGGGLAVLLSIFMKRERLFLEGAVEEGGEPRDV